MKYILFFLYSIGIHLGDLYLYIGKKFSDKLQLLYTGRKETWRKLSEFATNNKNNKTIWIHCASLGEFEQGRPVIEWIKQHHPDKKIVLSFFSPSGYEIRKEYQQADLILYLPSDLKTNNKRLLSLIKPSAVIFVKYEFWWNLIQLLTRSQIPVFLISAIFRKEDYFFNPLFRPFLASLKLYQNIFVQDEVSESILKKHGFKRVVVAGDTRIDRVIERALSPELPEKIKTFADKSTLVVYGSIWISDIAVVKKMILSFPGFKHILVPHQISETALMEIKKAIALPMDVYSVNGLTQNVLLIDNIGMLSSLYAVAKYAYVGGGFQYGIHNILEPAVYTIPVFFGPNHKKFNEAVNMQKNQMAFGIQGYEEMAEIIKSFESNDAKYMEIRNKIQDYFQDNRGATKKIISHLVPYLH